MNWNDHPFRATATCSSCDKSSTVVVTCGEIKRFVYGSELVQKIWPDLSADDRETLIGWRSQRHDDSNCGEPTGFHLCGDCWDNQLGDDYE